MGLRALFKMVLLLVVVALEHGCGADGLERTLRLADENRSELEKVLEHYRQEPLKREGSRYLIR